MTLLTFSIFALAVVLTGVLRRIALSRGLFDIPNERSSHSRPTPRLGGVAVVLSFLLGIAWLALRQNLNPAYGQVLIGGTLVVAAAGLVDDLRGLSVRTRLVVQFGIAAVTVAQIGVVPVLQVGPYQWEWGYFGFAICTAGLVWLINLNNFMDGIDGLAGGHMTAAALVLVGVIYLREPEHALIGPLLLVAAACSGFLVWNWPPARIFLGDSGSGSLGFIFGALILMGAKLGIVNLWAGLIPFGVFVVDATVTLCRRVAAGPGWTAPHRSHAYQHASRRFGHLWVTLSVIGIVLSWLAGASWLAVRDEEMAVFILLVAFAPLAILAWWMKAGKPEQTGISTSPVAEPSDVSPGLLGGGLLRSLHRLEYSRLFSRGAIWTAHVGIFLICGLSAFLLRFDFSVPENHRHTLLLCLAAWSVVKPASFALHGLGQGWWRYVSLPDLKLLFLANLVGSFGSTGIIFIATAHIGSPWFSRSIFIIDFVLCLLATTGIRVITRMLLEAVVETRKSVRKRALIYGAGSAGVLLLREARSNPEFPYDICGFLDDQPSKRFTRIHGLPVLGGGEHLARLVRSELIDQVLIAIPDASGRAMAGIVERCQHAAVACKTVPSQTELIESGTRGEDRKGTATSTGLRDVKVEDLLGRSAVRLEEDAIRQKLGSKVVLVTGAGGSIGSELCRQIARFAPSAIIGYEVGETPLFAIEQEMRRRFPKVEFIPEIGSIQDAKRLEEVFVRHEPSIVYHAAAYKHVPMMERHIFEAVENNVLGTRNVALAARNHGATDFVMISTDKAVRPSSLMGATKRVTEIAINALNQGRTKFVSVRFGNVLGSNGSVLPIFRQAIAEGGPVRVTDPEVRRYFMTIPEASQLVLQASTMGRGGEIFTLDMGEPVRILDLARNLIRLSGLKPDEDIKIEFTGLRPGEKLYEELSRIEEGAMPTYHEKIRIFRGPAMNWAECTRRLERLRVACQMRDAALLVSELEALIPDYTPSQQILSMASESETERIPHPAAAS